MMKIDAHSHVGKGAAVWSGQDVVDRMNTMGVDKTIIFPFTEGYFNNEDILGYVEENPQWAIIRGTCGNLRAILSNSNGQLYKSAEPCTITTPP